VAEDDLVHSVIHAVQRLALSAFAVKRKGCGDEQYPSHMMLALLADCGYADKEDLQRLGRDRPDLELYVSVHREDAHAPRRYDYRPLDKVKTPRRLKDPVLVAMAEKLKSPEGRAVDRRRVCTVEPVFGVMKAVLGFGQLLLRGLKKVGGEWALVWLAYNVKRLHRLGAGWTWPGQAKKAGGGLNSGVFGR
jgi:hypothetical protein